MVKLKEISNLFSAELWTMDTTGKSPLWRRIVRLTKLVRITVSEFFDNKMGFQCVSLCYFVSMAIVPLCAFLFAVTGGLGLEDKLSGILFSLLPNNGELVSLILDKAQNMIDTAKGGGVGIVSALFFLWTILWMMFQVERVFNNVWGINKIPRKLFNRFGFYCLVLFLSPFIVLIFGSGIAVYTKIGFLFGVDMEEVRIIQQILGWLVFYILTVFTISVMYKFIPAADVKYIFALKSALIAGVVFTVFQFLYLKTQFFVARINSVYGVIAAIPLFLIWLNFSWQIIIYGAELTYSYHHVDTYNIPEWEDEK